MRVTVSVMAAPMRVWNRLRGRTGHERAMVVLAA